MAIKYHLTPLEIVKLLGYTKPAAKEELQQFEQKNNIKLPTQLFDFLSYARNNPLFSTADIWASELWPYFSYQYIEEGIEDCRQDFTDPKFCEGNDFYPFSKIPKEQWPDLVANYLHIGSDYAAGVVFFGIEEKDLTQENPPVYLQHEADPITDWKLMFHTLTDYLMNIVLDILTCEYYDTGAYVLEKSGWNLFKSEYDNEEEMRAYLLEKNIDLSKMPKHASCFKEDPYHRCCFDESEKVLYIITNDIIDHEIQVVAWKKY